MLLILFAESADGRDAAVIAIASILGGVAAKLGDFFWEWFKERRADSRGDKKSLVDHLQALNDRMTAEKDRCEAEQRRTNYRLRVQELTAIQMLNHIRYLERLLLEKGLDFHTYEPPELPKEDDGGDRVGGSRAHPVAPDSETEGGD